MWVPTVMRVHPDHCRTEYLHTDGIVVDVRCITTVFMFINLQIEKLCFICLTED